MTLGNLSDVPVDVILDHASDVSNLDVPSGTASPEQTSSQAITQSQSGAGEAVASNADVVCDVDGCTLDASKDDNLALVTKPNQSNSEVVTHSVSMQESLPSLCDAHCTYAFTDKDIVIFENILDSQVLLSATTEDKAQRNSRPVLAPACTVRDSPLDVSVGTFFGDDFSNKVMDTSTLIVPWCMQSIWHWNVLEIYIENLNSIRCRRFDTDGYVYPVDDDTLKIVQGVFVEIAKKQVCQNQGFPADAGNFSVNTINQRQQVYAFKGQQGVNCGLVSTLIAEDLRSGRLVLPWNDALESFRPLDCYGGYYNSNMTDLTLRQWAKGFVAQYGDEQQKVSFCCMPIHNDVASLRTNQTISQGLPIPLQHAFDTMAEILRVDQLHMMLQNASEMLQSSTSLGDKKSLILAMLQSLSVDAPTIASIQASFSIATDASYELQSEHVLHGQSIPFSRSLSLASSFSDPGAATVNQYRAQISGNHLSGVDDHYYCVYRSDAGPAYSVTGITMPATKIYQSRAMQSRQYTLTFSEQAQICLRPLLRALLQPSPASAQPYLQSHQADAVLMVIDAYFRGYGFLLADQPGTGKTRTLIAAAACMQLLAKAGYLTRCSGDASVAYMPSTVPAACIILKSKDQLARNFTPQSALYHTHIGDDQPWSLHADTYITSHDLIKALKQNTEHDQRYKMGDLITASEENTAHGLRHCAMWLLDESHEQLHLKEFPSQCDGLPLPTLLLSSATPAKTHAEIKKLIPLLFQDHPLPDHLTKLQYFEQYQTLFAQSFFQCLEKNALVCNRILRDSIVLDMQIRTKENLRSFFSLQAQWTDQDRHYIALYDAVASEITCLRQHLSDALRGHANASSDAYQSLCKRFNNPLVAYLVRCQQDIMVNHLIHQHQVGDITAIFIYEYCENHRVELLRREISKLFRAQIPASILASLDRLSDLQQQLPEMNATAFKAISQVSMNPPEVDSHMQVVIFTQAMQVGENPFATLRQSDNTQMHHIYVVGYARDEALKWQAAHRAIRMDMAATQLGERLMIHFMPFSDISHRDDNKSHHRSCLSFSRASRHEYNVTQQALTHMMEGQEIDQYLPNIKDLSIDQLLLEMEMQPTTKRLAFNRALMSKKQQLEQNAEIDLTHAVPIYCDTTQGDMPLLIYRLSTKVICNVPAIMAFSAVFDRLFNCKASDVQCRHSHAMFQCWEIGQGFSGESLLTVDVLTLIRENHITLITQFADIQGSFKRSSPRHDSHRSNTMSPRRATSLPLPASVRSTDSPVAQQASDGRSSLVDSSMFAASTARHLSASQCSRHMSVSSRIPSTPAVDEMSLLSHDMQRQDASSLDVLASAAGQQQRVGEQIHALDRAGSSMAMRQPRRFCLPVRRVNSQAEDSDQAQRSMDQSLPDQFGINAHVPSQSLQALGTSVAPVVDQPRSAASQSLHRQVNQRPPHQPLSGIEGLALAFLQRSDMDDFKAQIDTVLSREMTALDGFGYQVLGALFDVVPLMMQAVEQHLEGSRWISLYHLFIAQNAGELIPYCEQYKPAKQSTFLGIYSHPDEGDSRGWTLLHTAVFYHQVECVRYLCEQAADIPDLLDCLTGDEDDRSTALHMAVAGFMTQYAECADAGSHASAEAEAYRDAFVTIIQLLLDAGANPMLVDFTGKTPYALLLDDRDQGGICVEALQACLKTNDADARFWHMLTSETLANNDVRPTRNSDRQNGSANSLSGRKRHALVQGGERLSKSSRRSAPVLSVQQDADVNSFAKLLQAQFAETIRKTMDERDAKMREVSQWLAEEINAYQIEAFVGLVSVYDVLDIAHRPRVSARISAWLSSTGFGWYYFSYMQMHSSKSSACFPETLHRYLLLLSFDEQRQFLCDGDIEVSKQRYVNTLRVIENEIVLREMVIKHYNRLLPNRAAASRDSLSMPLMSHTSPQVFRQHMQDSLLHGDHERLSLLLHLVDLDVDCLLAWEGFIHNPMITVEAKAVFLNGLGFDEWCKMLRDDRCALRFLNALIVGGLSVDVLAQYYAPFERVRGFEPFSLLLGDDDHLCSVFDSVVRAGRKDCLKFCLEQFRDVAKLYRKHRNTLSFSYHYRRILSIAVGLRHDAIVEQLINDSYVNDLTTTDWLFIYKRACMGRPDDAVYQRIHAYCQALDENSGVDDHQDHCDAQKELHQLLDEGVSSFSIVPYLELMVEHDDVAQRLISAFDDQDGGICLEGFHQWFSSCLAVDLSPDLYGAFESLDQALMGRWFSNRYTIDPSSSLWWSLRDIEKALKDDKEAGSRRDYEARLALLLCACVRGCVSAMLILLDMLKTLSPGRHNAERLDLLCQQLAIVFDQPSIFARIEHNRQRQPLLCDDPFQSNDMISNRFAVMSLHTANCYGRSAWVRQSVQLKTNACSSIDDMLVMREMPSVWQLFSDVMPPRPAKSPQVIARVDVRSLMRRDTALQGYDVQISQSCNTTLPDVCDSPSSDSWYVPSDLYVPSDVLSEHMDLHSVAEPRDVVSGSVSKFVGLLQELIDLWMQKSVHTKTPREKSISKVLRLASRRDALILMLCAVIADKNYVVLNFNFFLSVKDRIMKIRDHLSKPEVWPKLRIWLDTMPMLFHFILGLDLDRCTADGLMRVLLDKESVTLLAQCEGLLEKTIIFESGDGVRDRQAWKKSWSSFFRSPNIAYGSGELASFFWGVRNRSVFFNRFQRYKSVFTAFCDRLCALAVARDLCDLSKKILLAHIDHLKLMPEYHSWVPELRRNRNVYLSVDDAVEDAHLPIEHEGQRCLFEAEGDASHDDPGHQLMPAQSRAPSIQVIDLTKDDDMSEGDEAPLLGGNALFAQSVVETCDADVIIIDGNDTAAATNGPQPMVIDLT